MESAKKLPKHVLNTILEVVFERSYTNGGYKYIGKFKNFNEGELIHLTEVLKQYYTLEQQEENALMHLYAWAEAQKTLNVIQSDYSKLTGAFRDISSSIDRAVEIERERVHYERERHYNERRKDMKWGIRGDEQELQRIYKAVAYEKMSFDEFATRYSIPSPSNSLSISLPSISIDSEVFAKMDEQLHEQRKKIEAMTDVKNEGFSTLKQYVYRIVRIEEIAPIENNE